MDGDEILTLYPILLKDLKMPSIWFYSSEENSHPHQALHEETAAGEGKRWVQSHTVQGRESGPSNFQSGVLSTTPTTVAAFVFFSGPWGTLAGLGV